MTKQHKIYDFHIARYLGMINDRWRNIFYLEALQKYSKDKIVLDMGTGTGILAFYALASGAKFVYCIERNPIMAGTAEKILSKQFDKSRFVVVNANFWTDEIEGKINDKIDILVSETVGPGLFDQGMFHTWHSIKPYLSDDSISIPDALHCDFWIWDVNDIDTSPYSYPGDQDKSYRGPMFDAAAVIDQDFAKALIEVDSEQKIDKNWGEINKINTEPKLKYRDTLRYTMDQVPELVFTSNPYPTHIIPNISFEIDIDFPCYAAIINKISFEDQTLYLKDASLSPWKYNPIFHLPSKGKYSFTYNNVDLKHMPGDEWIYNIKESV